METIEAQFTPIRAAIDNVLQTVSGTRAYAAFDFDGTCIANDITEATLAYLCRHNLVRNRNLPGVKPGDGATYNERVLQRYYELLDTDMLGAYLCAAKSIAGFTEEEIAEIVAKTIAEEGEELGKTELFGVTIAHGLRARAAIQKLVQYLQAKGVEVWFITASPTVIVKAALAHFGYQGGLVGLTNKVDANDVLTDDVEEPYSIKDGKVACIKKFVDPETRPILAAGDSMNDAPMLEYADIKVVVDKGNALGTLAREQGWHLLEAA